MTGVQAEVCGLFVYPIKSCKGIRLTSAQLTPQGFRHDRQWMVVNDADRPQTQRDIPQLSQIETAFNGDTVVLSRTGHGSVAMPIAHLPHSGPETLVRTKLWKDECETVVASEEASRWLTQALASQRPVKLVRMAPGFTRPQSSPERLGADTHIQFADAGPFLIIDEASLQRLNEVLSAKRESAVPMNRFRPNIVVRGLQPFGEHAGGMLGNARYQLNFRVPCERCVVPTIDQNTSEAHPKNEPFNTLRDLNPRDLQKRQPLFGQYATLEMGAGEKIAVGDVLSPNQFDFNSGSA